MYRLRTVARNGMAATSYHETEYEALVEYGKAQKHRFWKSGKLWIIEGGKCRLLKEWE
jgi:hypothetical protein